MGDQKRVAKVLKIIAVIWSECPDMRLGQLLVNAISPSDCIDTDIFNIEDDALVRSLADFWLPHASDEAEDYLLVHSGILSDALTDVGILTDEIRRDK